jgi:hypothetical protein
VSDRNTDCELPAPGKVTLSDPAAAAWPGTKIAPMAHIAAAAKAVVSRLRPNLTISNGPASKRRSNRDDARRPIRHFP